MKKLLAVFAAFMVLAGALAVSAAAPAFSCDFENGIPSAFAEGHNFTVKEEGGNKSLWLNDSKGWVHGGLDVKTYNYANFTMTCDVKIMAFDGNSAAFHLYFRSDGTNSDNAQGYCFTIGYKKDRLPADNLQIQLERAVHDGSQLQFEFPAKAQDIEGKITLNTWNKMIVIAEGDKFEFWLGPKLDKMKKVYEAKDKTFKSGTIRFATWESQAQIDNLSIVPTVNRPTGGNSGNQGGNNQGGNTSKPPVGGNTGGNNSQGGANQGGNTTINNDVTINNGSSSNTSGSSSDAGSSSSNNSSDTSNESNADNSSSKTSAKTDEKSGISPVIIVGIIVAVVAVGGAVTLVILSRKKKSE